MTTLPIAAWYNNILEEPVTSITVSSEDTTDGFFKENAYQWTLATRWRTDAGSGAHTYEIEFTGSETGDFWGIAGHNLGDVSASVRFQRWNGASWENVGALFTPTGREVICEPFTSASSTRWRLNVTTSTDDIEIGLIFFGPRLTFERGLRSGWGDPALSQRARVTHDKSRNGVWIGSSLLNLEAEQDISLENVTSSWAITNWQPFARRCQYQPFLLFWNSDEYTDSACYCSDAKFGNSPFTSREFVSLAANFRTETEP